MDDGRAMLRVYLREAASGRKTAVGLEVSIDIDADAGEEAENFRFLDFGSPMTIVVMKKTNDAGD